MNIQTEITVKIEPFFSSNQNSNRCPHCASKMIPVNRAARLIGCSPRAISGWIQLGWVHFTQNQADSFQICPQSIGEIIKIN